MGQVKSTTRALFVTMHVCLDEDFADAVQQDFEDWVGQPCDQSRSREQLERMCSVLSSWLCAHGSNRRPERVIASCRCFHIREALCTRAQLLFTRTPRELGGRQQLWASSPHTWRCEKPCGHRLPAAVRAGARSSAGNIPKVGTAQTRHVHSTCG